MNYDLMSIRFYFDAKKEHQYHVNINRALSLYEEQGPAFNSEGSLTGP